MKYTHIPKRGRSGGPSNVARCGRLVSRLGMTTPDKADCPKCRRSNAYHRTLYGNDIPLPDGWEVEQTL